MLRGFLEELREPRNAGPSIFAGAVGLLLGIALGALLLGAKDASFTQAAQRDKDPRSETVDLLDGPDEPRRDSSGGPNESDYDAGVSRSEVRRALEDARRDAEAHGGTAEVAIWVDGWKEPVTVGDPGPMRMWSISKPVVALALLDATGGQLPPGVQTALRDAITKSDNCAVRLLTLELQRRAGGPDGARTAFGAILEEAGVPAPVVAQEKPADAVCHPYLRKHGNERDLATPAVLFGTAEWTIRDAAVFAGALAQGELGDHGEQILGLMAEPKHPDPLAKPEEFTADPMFGAGIALRSRRPAYKGGWGGSQTPEERFMVGQVVTLDAGSRKVGIAAMFHPHDEPALDDPGSLNSPAALEAIFRAVDARVLEPLAGDP